MISDNPSIISSAFEKTKAAFASGKTRDIDFREEQIANLHKGFTEMKDAIEEALKKDLGYNDYYCFFLGQGLVHQEILHTLKNFRKWTAIQDVDTPKTLQPGKSYLIPEPLGVVLVLGPWNVPFVCTLTYVATAIAAGNCVVLKPSELAPNTSNVMAALFDKYLDKDCFVVVEGEVKVASQIVTYPWDHIVFTGGVEKGKKVAMAAAANLVPYILELGGKCPAFVDKDADLESASLRIIDTRMINWGQACIAPDYVLAHNDIKAELTKLLKEKMLQFFGEDPFQSPDKVKIITQGHVKRLESYLTQDHNGKFVYLGGDGKVKLEERYVPPAIIDSPRLDSLIMNEENFGPFLSIIEVQDIDEAIKFINSRPKPLAAYYYGKADNPNKEKFLNKTSSGGVTVNDCCYHVFNCELPFGGIGNSGSGALKGEIGFRNLSHLKPVLERETSNGYPENLRYPPYGPKRIQEFMDLMNPKTQE